VFLEKTLIKETNEFFLLKRLNHSHFY